MSYRYPSRNRTDEEIDDLLNECYDAEEAGRSRYRNMTYEQGIRAAIDWLLDTGTDDVYPLE